MKWLIVIGVVLLLIVVVISMYNGLVKLRNMVEEAFSTMDVYLKKRYDLVPNLVNTVKGYASHEKETLEAVISARNAAVDSSNPEARLEAENQLTQTIGRLFALSESYPDLKANQNFMDLQKQLQSLEAEIAQSRKYYNGIVRQYNIKTQTVPTNIIANMFGFEKKPLFEVQDEVERQNVNVEF